MLITIDVPPRIRIMVDPTLEWASVTALISGESWRMSIDRLIEILVGIIHERNEDASIAWHGALGCIRASLDLAARAMIEGDVVGMIRAYKELKEFHV